MNDREEIKENEILEEHKIVVNEKENKDDNSESTNQEEKENNKKPTEETLIIPENKSKTLENNENSLINNKNSSSPLIGDNMYLNNKLKDDHYILIEHTKFLKIPYFIFGFTTHFYYPSERLQTKMKLSEIPNPPFTLGEDGKFIFYNK
jgi:hypothetical protein